jgi:hypothetical protein
VIILYIPLMDASKNALLGLSKPSAMPVVMTGLYDLYVYSDACRVLAYKKQTKQVAGSYRNFA